MLQSTIGLWALSAGLAAIPIAAEAFNCDETSYNFTYTSTGGTTGSGDLNYSTNCTTTTENTPTNICLGSIQYALVVAKRFFENCSAGTFTIQFSGTTYDFSNEATLASNIAGAIDVGGINTTASQRLVITGTPFSGMPSLTANPPRTTIITNIGLAVSAATNPPTPAAAIDGNASGSQNMSHITFQYLAFTQNQSSLNSGSSGGGLSTMNGDYLYGATQGTLVSYPGSGGANSVTIEITPGFPYPVPYTPNGQPYGLFNLYFDQGRYFRVYTNSATNPQLVASSGTINNAQVPWGNTLAGCPAANQSSVTVGTVTYNTCLPSQDPIDPNKWTFYLDNSSWSLPTSPSSYIICIKSKAYWDDAYYFDGHGSPSNDIVFDHILWIGNARGVFRGGMTGLRITNSAIVTPPPIVSGGASQAPCIGTSEGGPQIGEPTDPATSNNQINNFVAQSMGDEAIAFIGDSGTGTSTSSVMNATINDDFAPPIALYSSPNVYLGDPVSNSNSAWSWAYTNNSLIDADPSVMFTGTYYYPMHNPENLPIPNPPPNGLSYSP